MDLTDHPSLNAVLSAFAVQRIAPNFWRLLLLNESRDNVNDHWAAQPDQPLTEADLRLLHELAHDPHPERPEHLRSADRDLNGDAAGYETGSRHE